MLHESPSKDGRARNPADRAGSNRDDALRADGGPRRDGASGKVDADGGAAQRVLADLELAGVYEFRDPGRLEARRRRHGDLRGGG